MLCRFLTKQLEEVIDTQEKTGREEAMAVSGAHSE